MLKKIRTTLALVFFIGITLLFLDFTGTMHRWLTWMTRVQALEAVLALNVGVVLALIVLTLVFGRIYCSVICPLGVFQDVIARVGKRVKKNRYTYSKALSWLRYSVLGIFIVALVAGVGSIFQLLAPYSAYGRIATTIFQPLWKLANNGLASIAEHLDSYAFYSVDVLLPSFGAVLAIAGITCLVLIPLAFSNGRTYCNTICPVGTALSFLARFSWLKVRFVEDKCRKCSKCTKNCKAACIDYKTQTVDYSRCVVCGDCISQCNFGALRFAPKPLPKKEGSNISQASKESRNQNDKQSTPLPHRDGLGGASTSPSRRSFLLATSLITTAALAQEKKKVDGGLAIIEDKVAPKRQTPITPPGSISAQHMAKHCTGCQLCVSECPNNVLRPSTDLMHLMMPTSSYEVGYCRPECNRCSQVCPAGAIKPLRHEDKASTQIGHAVWIKKNCIPLRDGVECGNCARHCPVGAIEMVPSDPDDDESAYVPAVNENRCIGCGACENLCPARPYAAIYVEGHEAHRTI
ncbi:MAG: 4Fe-4S binding protein [Prevotella sp.]|nr:4Fe-4S binding protein [Prevotella sp.]